MIRASDGERNDRDERDENVTTHSLSAGSNGRLYIDRTKCSWKHDKLEALFARPFIGRVACVRAYELSRALLYPATFLRSFRPREIFLSAEFTSRVAANYTFQQLIRGTRESHARDALQGPNKSLVYE